MHETRQKPILVSEQIEKRRNLRGSKQACGACRLPQINPHPVLRLSSIRLDIHIRPDLLRDTDKQHKSIRQDEKDFLRTNGSISFVRHHKQSTLLIHSVSPNSQSERISTEKEKKANRKNAIRARCDHLLMVMAASFGILCSCSACTCKHKAI